MTCEDSLDKDGQIVLKNLRLLNIKNAEEFAKDRKNGGKMLLRQWVWKTSNSPKEENITMSKKLYHNSKKCRIIDMFHDLEDSKTCGMILISRYNLFSPCVCPKKYHELIRRWFAFLTLTSIFWRLWNRVVGMSSNITRLWRIRISAQIPCCILAASNHDWVIDFYPKN